jgi:hypothetical protein
MLYEVSCSSNNRRFYVNMSLFISASPVPPSTLAYLFLLINIYKFSSYLVGNTL